MLQKLALSFPCLVCFFWAITLSIRWKKNLRTQNIWAVASFLAAINAFYWMRLYTPGLEVHSYTGMVISFTNLGFYCVLYLFYFSLIDHRPFNWKHYLILAPAVAHGTVNNALIFIIGKEELEAFMNALTANNWMPPEDMSFLLTVHYYLGSLIGILTGLLLINLLLILILVRVVAYRDKRKDFFPPAPNSSRRQSWAILFGLSILLVGMLCFLMGDFLYSIENYIPFPVLFALQGILFFFLGYHVYFLEKPTPNARPI
ncbi:hypothetical protein [Parabacteroides sp. PF5-6]|uniref:hypothetical protein n=1 Tax=Parabacteroides sp. PF5-6 TaxID=1742403 RepID=UPI002405F679|nr:hypothetical protein [Parabacteroides sp. PF5-6]MDF9831369.1 cbb3-type cytochrome oxidase subunit 3 [Parabacteroides sp. PF5-6]